VSVFILLATELAPILVKIAPELGNACRRGTILPGNVQGAFPSHQVQYHPAISVATGQQPSREIQPKANLFIHWRLGVIVERFIEQGAVQAFSGPERVGGEMMPPLCPERQHVFA
jgi:hypothetical protein